MKKKKILLKLLVFCSITAALSGCQKNAVVTSTAASTPTSTSSNVVSGASASANTNELVTFKDSAGREVKIPSKISKIAPSGSLAQIVLFPLVPDMFVGLSDKWSGEAQKYLDTKYYNLPVLGQFYGTQNLNLEQIAKVNPELIIDVGESKSTIVEDMNNISSQIKIPAVHIEATTATMPEAYRTLGKLLGKEKEAEVLAKYCEETYKKTQDIMNSVGDKGKVKLLYCSGNDGLSVIAKGSFHAEVLDMVSDNVAVLKNFSSKGSGDPVDMEQIALWNPDVILFAPGSIYSTVGADPAWQKLDAIKNRKYYEVPSGPYNWMGFPPSVNRYIGMLWITQLLYPDKAQYDMYKETAKYYELFYHSKLTEDQYKALVQNSLLKK